MSISKKANRKTEILALKSLEGKAFSKDEKDNFYYGCMKETLTIHGDIVNFNVSDDWEAIKEYDELAGDNS